MSDLLKFPPFQVAQKELVTELCCIQFKNIAVDKRWIHYLFKTVLGREDCPFAQFDLPHELSQIILALPIRCGWFFPENQTATLLYRVLMVVLSGILQDIHLLEFLSNSFPKPISFSIA